jgi:hypothetical protein
MLRQDQLLVDRYAVNKITKVEYPLPQNIVTVHLTNQMTGQESTRDLQWDSQHTTEEPFEVEVGDTGKIKVELALLADEENRPAYKYKITDDSAGSITRPQIYASTEMIALTTPKPRGHCSSF